MKKRSKIKAAARARRRAAAKIDRVMVTVPGEMNSGELEQLMQTIARWRAKGGTLPVPDIPGLRVAAWDEKGHEIRIDCTPAALYDARAEVQSLHALIDELLAQARMHRDQLIAAEKRRRQSMDRIIGMYVTVISLLGIAVGLIVRMLRG